MKAKRIMAGVLTSAMLLGQTISGISGIVSAESNKSSMTFNKEGLWLTEIFNNDVDRSTKNDKRSASGYEKIKTYKSTTDLMEYFEITSTHEADIKLNELYKFFYGDKQLTVTDMEGNSDITVKKGQAVVVWNYRSDVSGTIPTEEEFRAQMNIPSQALVIKTECAVNWDVNADFSIKKSDGTVVSHFRATRFETNQPNGTTMDGFGVELKIPDVGSEMQVYRKLTMPTPGYIYNGQLNGLVSINLPEGKTTADGLFVTEVRPNDINRSSVYGIADDLMECVELTNTTDKDIVLGKDYEIQYAVKEGSKKVLDIAKYDENTEDHIGNRENCVIPAGKTAVLWCWRAATLKGYTSYPTEKDFRSAYKIDDSVPVYIFTNQNGLNNTNRAFETYKKNDDGTKTLVSSYSYIGSVDCKDNKSAVLSVNPEGPEMFLYAANATSSMGAVDAVQYTYLQDDGSRMTIAPDEKIPESVDQGNELRVSFSYENSTLPRTGITTYFRFDGKGEWFSRTETSRRVPNHYDCIIMANELFGHEYVEFYVSADNRYHSALSEIYRVNINQLGKVDGTRINIKDGEKVRGSVTVTANDGNGALDSRIYIDGAEYQTQPTFENGAYFTFLTSGRDSYFKNAVSTTDNDIVFNTGKWQYQVPDGFAERIDNKYFTYDKAAKSYNITLRLWAGTYGATVEDYLMPDANREDFEATQLALKLTNGKTYTPVKIGPDDAATSAKTNLSTDYNALHKIGDSAGMCPYMDVSFTIPETDVDAVGTLVDTTKLSDGKHKLTVTNAGGTYNVNFIVDNTAPEINLGIEDGAELTGKLSFDPIATDANTLNFTEAYLDGELITTPFDISAFALGEGKHTLSYKAEDEAGNVAEKTAAFTVAHVDMDVIKAQTSDIGSDSAKLSVQLKTDSDTTVKFYKAEQIKPEDITAETSDGIQPYIKYSLNVADASEDDVINLSWNGKASDADNTRAAAMYAVNRSTGKWDKIAAADKDGKIANTDIAIKDYVSDGKIDIIIQCTADSKVPDLETSLDGKKDVNADWTGDTAPKNYDFCFAWETDTQYYAEEWQHHFLNINNWIVDNAAEKKIRYVIHTGDIVDDCDMTYQWENADEAMGILDKAEMPYGVLGGNHDVAAGLADYGNYYKYFGEDRFKSQPTYGGSYMNNKGHYDLVSEGGQDFIIVYMSWNIYQDEIDWMNNVLAQYSDRKAILCFHTYTNVKTSTDTLLDYFGELVQTQVVAKNPNVFAVLNGHYHGSSYETAMFDDDGDGVKERTVYQICTDYQSGFEGGNEYIKFLYFDLDNNKIFMNSYSPCLDDYNFYDDKGVAKLNSEGAMDIEIDKMELDVNFRTAPATILSDSFTAYLKTSEEYGEATADSLTGTAQITAENLEAETGYLWYAKAKNANTGVIETEVLSFTTDKAAEQPVPNPDEPTPDPVPGTSDEQPGTPDPVPGTSDEQPGTPDPVPGTSDEQPGTPDPVPGKSDSTEPENPEKPNHPENPDSGVRAEPIYALLAAGAFSAGVIMLTGKKRK